MEFEERNRLAFMLERAAKAVDRLATAAYQPQWPRPSHETPGLIEETDEFRATRIDTGDGPEAILIERK